MNRRTLFLGLGEAVALALWRNAGAQQGNTLPRIGVLAGGSSSTETEEAFISELARLGWRDGATARIERRGMEGDPRRATALSRDLVSLSPAVIWSESAPALAALLRATSSIPIVFSAVTGPVESGFVKSLAHPGGNATGFAVSEPSLGTKWLEILKEVAPQVTHVGILMSVDTPQPQVALRDTIVASAPALGVTATTIALRQATDIAPGIAAFAGRPDRGLIVQPNAITLPNRDEIVMLAARFGMPAIYPYDTFVRSGGLVAYGIDRVALARQSAAYVDRILRGAKPTDLPIQLPTKFILAINLKAAKALGLTIPPTLLARADEVME